MRPRVFPAEDDAVARDLKAAGHASMRPRVFPAEDAGDSDLNARAPPGFNEAAGIPRGRRRLHLVGVGDDRASMRPRVFPAEDAVAAGAAAVVRHRFNEAAGIPRGRPRRRTSTAGENCRFNEAAGIPRGRLKRRLARKRRQEALQ